MFERPVAGRSQALSGPAVEARVEINVESLVDPRLPLVPQLRLLGPMAIERDGVPLALPSSRKVRALIAYLALATRPLGRDALCELLWDLPNDPRGELRWSLSKARALLDEPGHPRLLTEGDTVRLDTRALRVDAAEILAAVQAGVATLEPERLQALEALFVGGDFLQGLEIERSAPYSAWLLAQRRRLRAANVAILDQLVHGDQPPGPNGEARAIARLEQWLALAPFDRRAHEGLLDALARGGRLHEGDEHLDATARRFEAEGQDWAPIGRAWQAAKARHAAAAAAAAAMALPARTPAGPNADAAVLRPTGSEAAAALPPAATEPTPRRASVAVLPFSELGSNGAPGLLRGGLADGLVHDVITRLAKLRSLFVISQGTVFALDAQRVGPDEAGRALNVDYVASGQLRRRKGSGAGQHFFSVSAQLTETRSARIVWADEFTAHDGVQTFEVIEQIGNHLVAAIDQQIEAAERNRAILKPPSSLDAWEAHHRGLWHMVRFNREDNDQARYWFEAAIRLDPTFARPYAGLSFTHFQNAFLGWGEREPAVEQAYRIASQGLMTDERDPAVHWALGRALWLRGRIDDSLAELDTSVALSPNFAHGHYTLGFIHSQSGDAATALREADHSRELSPYDPLLFAMQATRALALMRLGRHAEAADWALKAVARPNAHAHILAIAAHCLALAGRGDEAREVSAELQRRLPGYRVDDLLGAFRFAPDVVGVLCGVSAAIGLG